MTVSEFTEILTPWQLSERPDWQLTRIKYHFDIILGKMLQNTPQRLEDIEVPYLKAQHIQWDRVQRDELPIMWASPEEIEALRVKQGDLLVCEGGEVGRSVIVTDPLPANCIIQNALHLVRPKSSGNLRFLRYLLQHAASNQWLDVLCNRTTIAHFTTEKFKEMWVWLPPLSEQRVIADYLDNETAKIDELIVAKKQLLDLLAEKRLALITHAVTCGLNPDVPMRDSGVEWLGEVPAHWEIKRLRFLIFGIDTGFSPQCYNYPAHSGEWGVLKTGCVNGGVFNPGENKALPDDIVPPLELEVNMGDVLMSRASGSTELIGSVALVDTKFDTRLLLSDKVFRIRVNSHLCDAKFFVILMGSFFVRQQILRIISGAAGLANNIAQSDIRELLLPLPSISEQRSITALIEQKIQMLDDLSNKALKTLDLLFERRSAMITAAVTGQIQVMV